MLYHRLLKVFCLLIIGLGVAIASPQAQPMMAQDNLLKDPSFENGAFNVIADRLGDEGVLCTVPADWGGWITESPRTADWQNRVPTCTPQTDKPQGFVRSGNRSHEFSRGGATFTAAIYQTVGVPAAGTNVIGEAHYVMEVGDGSTAQVRVGIDPNGGTNPFSSSIVWSNWGGVRRNTDGFGPLTVNATSTGTSVTLFIYVTQAFPTDPNKVFIDDASLVIGGGGAPVPQDPAAPPPTATLPPVVVANFVTAQGAQPDGSIIHTVLEGDTLSAIATAYRVPIDTLRELNPDIGRGSFLFVGQRLLIQPAPSATGGVVQQQPTQAVAVPVFATPTQVAAAPSTPLRPRPPRQPNAGWLSVEISPPDPQSQGQNTDSTTVAHNAPPSETLPPVLVLSTNTPQPTATDAIPPTATDAIPPTATDAIPPTATDAIPPTATDAIPPTATDAIPPTATNIIPPTATNLPQAQGNTSLFATATPNIPVSQPTEVPTEEIEEVSVVAVATEIVDPTATTQPTNTDVPVVVEPTNTDVPVIEPTNTDVPVIEPTNTDVPVVIEPTTVAMNPEMPITGICVTFFDDINRNRVPDIGETPIIDGVLTLRFAGQDLSAFLTTGEPAPYCFSDLAPGNYLVVATPPEGFGMTTPAQFQLRVEPDTQLDVVFGAAQGVEVQPIILLDTSSEQPALIEQPEATPDNTNDSLLANIGIIILAFAGITLVTGIIGTILISRR